MKKFKLIGFGIFVLGLVFGCSARDVTDNDIKATRTMGEIQTACYDAVKAQTVADTAIIKSAKADDRTMLTMVYLNNKQTIALVSTITGNSADRCSGTNIWDFLTAETKAKNKALSTGLGHATTMVKWVAGAWTASEIVGNIGATNTSSGYSSTSTTTTNEADSRNTATDDSHNTATDDSHNTTESTIETDAP